MKDELLIQFGLRVKCIRKQLGVSQEALAGRAGIDRSYMGRIERGQINLTLVKVNQIRQALNVNFSDLLDVDEKA